MAKNRHKHHRKVTQNRFTNEPKAQSTVVAEAVITSTNTPVSELAHVRQDLRQTGVVTAILVILLALGYFLNLKYHWTLEFGGFLYRLLHIG